MTKFRCLCTSACLPYFRHSILVGFWRDSHRFYTCLCKYLSVCHKVSPKFLWSNFNFGLFQFRFSIFCFLNHIFSFWLQFFLSVRVSIRCINSAYNTVISLNLMVWEFCGNAQCPQSFGWVAKFSQNFRTKKLCEISLFYAVKILFDVQVFSTNTLLKFCM